MEFVNWSLKRWVLSHIIITSVLLLILLQCQNVINGHLRLSVLNVGQGDAILIQTSEHKNILVDAGIDDSVISELGKKLSFFDKKIDLFVMTHPDRDHYAGILDVLQKYEIKKVMITGIKNPDSLYESFLEQIKANKTVIIFPRNNQDLQIGQNVYLDILFPFADNSLVGQKVKNKNNTSIVAKLITNNKCRILLTGDAEHALEREILLSGQNLNCPILKLGHHGAKTSTSQEFLNAVQPETAVVSAGLENKFGHPHQETLDKLDKIEVLQTVDGTVNFFWSPDFAEVRTPKKLW